MLKRIFPGFLGLTVFLAACGPQGTPTMAAADVQNTAMAAAWTMVAATQLAIPTATPVPPTETASPTPLPTFTPLALATLPGLFPTATQALAADPDTCLKPLNIAEAGPLKRTVIENKAGGPLNLSLNLYQKNAFGQCGALSYQLQKNGTIHIEIPVGFWFAYAWITLPNGSSEASGSFEVRVGAVQSGKLNIGKDVISYLSP